mmetsp:Transcript_11274/g.35929  ORF Transcript_11274/g.35929 Transcript_11274/m.35929 type:complete len:112 (-) Transcript_11274:25-360(-)
MSQPRSDKDEAIGSSCLFEMCLLSSRYPRHWFVELCYTEDGMNQVLGPCSGNCPFNVYFSYLASGSQCSGHMLAYLYLLYEDTRIRHPLLFFSCTLLVTEESGGCIGSSLA